jgi:uncharacterized lipoprotein YehR (DUF1307 family)
MNIKNLIFSSLLSITLLACGGSDSTSDTNSFNNSNAEGEQLTVTPSPFQNIDFFFEFEFLEDLEVLVDVLEKNTLNQLDEQTVTYSRNENTISIEVTYDDDEFGFSAILNRNVDTFDIVDVILSLNDEEINSTYSED